MKEGADACDLIISIIENLVYHGAEKNFAILNLGADYYVQLMASKGAYEVYCEAVGNYYLDTDSYLDDAQMNGLIQLSWHLPEESTGNFFLTHQVDSENARASLAKLILETAKLVYKVKEITLGDVVLDVE